MKFEYNSSKVAYKKFLPEEIVNDLRKYLQDKLHPDMTVGELQDILLAYRRPNGDRLLINQLEPVFTYLAQTGKLWDIIWSEAK